MALQWIEVGRYDYSPFGGRIKIKGITIGARQQIIERTLRVGTEVGLLREPDNEHDPNAIAVMLKKQQIGYIERRVAQWLAPKLESIQDDESCHGEIVRIDQWEPDNSDEVILLPSVAVVFTELQEVTTNAERLKAATAAGSKHVAMVTAAGVRSLPGLLDRLRRLAKSVVNALDSIIVRFAGEDATLKWIYRGVVLLIVAVSLAMMFM